MNIWLEKPELVEQLKDLWEEGYSASQCARKLGNGISRNACIGKINRMGIEMPTRTNVPRAPRERFKQNVGPKKPPYSPPPPPCAPDSLNIEIEQLTNKTCRWPEGDVSIGITFCGVLPRENSPYGPFHTKIAWAGKPLHARTAGAE